MVKKAAAKKGRDATQFCIDGYLIEDVLKQLSDKVSIIGAKVVVGKAFSKKKIAIPNSLKAKGVMALTHNVPSKCAHMVFDRIKGSVILKKVREVAKEIDSDADQAYFQYLTLDNGKGAGKFERTTKEIKPYDEDLRRKLVVLGLVDAQGNVNSLIKSLGAKKYVCHITTEQKRVLMCSQMTA